MKSIKIFLASSEELTDDRNAFGNLIRRLDKIYEKRGIRIELFQWEDYDAAYNDRRKQDEYNDQIKASDMFLALFHTKAGKFTIEEFNVATEEFKKHASPKVYTYCKDLKDGEQESPELAEFKHKLFNEMGHYWSRYNNRDSMQLHFVMQLQLVETSGAVEKLKLEEGAVMLEGVPVALLDNLKFAAGNEAYQKMSAEIATLPEIIEKARMRVEKFPDDEDLREDLQQKLNRLNHLKAEFSHLQKALFDTAQRITAMQLEQVSDMMRRAIEAFEEGNLERANTLLDEIAQEAEHHMEQLERQRDLVHQDIQAFQLQAKTTLADINLIAKERISKVYSIYAKAVEWAEKSALEKDKYIQLLFEFGSFLYEYAEYEKAIKIYNRLISLNTDHSSNPTVLANSYCNAGMALYKKGNCSVNDVLKYLYKAIEIMGENVDKESSAMANIYDNIGSILLNHSPSEALKYHIRALAIWEKLSPVNQIDLATTYNNVATAYHRQGDYSRALDFYSKALEIQRGLINGDSVYTATTYDNIGVIFSAQNLSEKAFEFHLKALSIYEKVLGEYHPHTAGAINNIGTAYLKQNLPHKALDYYERVLHIIDKLGIKEQANTAILYDNISLAYEGVGNIDKALESLHKSVAIKEKLFGEKHASVIESYKYICTLYYKQGRMDKVKEFFPKTLSEDEKNSTKSSSNIYSNRPDLEIAKRCIVDGDSFDKQGDNAQALPKYLAALAIFEANFDKSHPAIADMHMKVGGAYHKMKDYCNAVNAFSKALDIYEKCSNTDPARIKQLKQLIELDTELERKKAKGGDSLISRLINLFKN